MNSFFFQLQSYIVYEFASPAPGFFQLDPLSGNITLARSVLYDTSSSYVVSTGVQNHIFMIVILSTDITFFSLHFSVFLCLLFDHHIAVVIFVIWSGKINAYFYFYKASFFTLYHFKYFYLKKKFWLTIVISCGK